MFFLLLLLFVLILVGQNFFFNLTTKSKKTIDWLNEETYSFNLHLIWLCKSENFDFFLSLFLLFPISISSSFRFAFGRFRENFLLFLRRRK